MAPNKKKKKPVSNPARGFATTSTASKQKDDIAKEPESGVQPDVSDTTALSVVDEHGIPIQKSPNEQHEKALHQLTPEELESQLEDSGLQILVESHGVKTKKDASRQVSRLQTEKRLLRSQADHLGIRQWLPPEIMQIIMNLLQTQENSNGHLKASLYSNNANTDVCEDNLLIKLWALKRVLPMLEFPEQKTDMALHHLLTTMRKSGPQNLASSKEPVWGLDECLAWLALNSEPVDLPGLDGPSHFTSNQRTSKNSIYTPASTPTDSRPESPLSKDHSPQEPQTDGDSTLSSASESDSDAEPEQLVTKYLKLQSRLHDINPELTENDARRQRRGKGKNPIFNDYLDSSRKRRIERLRAKIHKIKSDLLFDEDEANTRWADIRIDLMQEAAERKRLGIRNDEEQQKATPTVRSNKNLPTSNGGNETDDDTDGMLSGFFSSLPEMALDPATGLSINSIASQEGTNVEIRDFGKWTGMTPRRVLEEACKAR